MSFSESFLMGFVTQTWQNTKNKRFWGYQDKFYAAGWLGTRESSLNSYSHFCVPNVKYDCYLVRVSANGYLREHFFNFAPTFAPQRTKGAPWSIGLHLNSPDFRSTSSGKTNPRKTFLNSKTFKKRVSVEFLWKWVV